ncbi:MAG TPA: tetratricopeptide repeat protein, partial [Thermoanaerobaculia bacterium]
MASKAGSPRGSRRSGSRSLWPLALLLALAGCASGRGAASQPVSTAGYGTAFAHGALAFQEGRDDEAAILFEEAIRQDPREGTARHWLGLTYLRLGRRDEAIAQLEASLRAERPPEAGRKRVQEDLRLARADSPPGPGLIVTPEGAAELPPLTGGADARWEGRIGIEALRDSNPALMPGDLPFPIFGLDEPASDTAAELDLRLGYQPFQGRRGWSLDLDVSGSHSIHQDLDELDLSLARGTVSLAWGSDRSGFLGGPLGLLRVPRTGGGRFTVLLQGSGARAWLGGDSYLDLAEGSVSFGFRETAWTATRIDVEVRDRSFEPALTDFFHGGREASLGLSQS